MKMVNGVEVEESASDIAQRAADVAEWNAGATRRALAAIDQQCGMDRLTRDMAIAALANGHAKKAAAIAAEAEAATLRGQL